MIWICNAANQPRASKRRLSPHLSESYPFGPQLYIFRGSIQLPVPLIHPAPNSRLRVYLRISLLTRWIGFGQVGLS
jgi:hypothetical protein